jgi:hypothetical protein
MNMIGVLNFVLRSCCSEKVFPEAMLPTRMEESFLYPAKVNTLKMEL